MYILVQLHFHCGGICCQKDQTISFNRTDCISLVTWRQHHISAVLFPTGSFLRWKRPDEDLLFSNLDSDYEAKTKIKLFCFFSCCLLPEFLLPQEKLCLILMRSTCNEFLDLRSLCCSALLSGVFSFKLKIFVCLKMHFPFFLVLFFSYASLFFVCPFWIRVF